MIFSDNYTVHHRYSLVSGERLADYSVMPWLYTSLVDSQYKPNLPLSIKNILNRVFEYSFTYATTRPVFDEEKFFGVYSTDDAIESFKTTVKYPWATFKDDLQRFKIETATLGSPLYDKVSEVLVPELLDVTAFTGVEQDANGNITGLSVQSREYNLSSYNNPALETAAEYSKIAPNYAEGILTIRNDDEVSLYSGFVYPRYISESSKELFRKNPEESFSIKYKKKITATQMSQSHILGYRANNVLTDDHIAVLDAIPYIQDMGNQNRLQIEHVFKGSELVDIIVHIAMYHQFEDMTKTYMRRQWYDENGNEITYATGGHTIGHF